MNTLFRKVYLWAGVIMAANMFVVNEVRAANSEDENEFEINEFDQGNSDSTGENALSLKNVLSSVLTYENYINFIGGLVFSGFNNYFKWWDYNPGWYGQFGCFGWRSGRFIKDIFQFEVNFINLGRGAFWLIATYFGSYKYLGGRIVTSELKCTAAVIMNSWRNSWPVEPMGIILFFSLSILQGFVSMPLAIHISNFSIAVSLDSIIWELAKLSTIVRVNMGKKQIKKDKMDDNNIVRESDLSSQNGEEDNENNKEENDENV